MTSRPTRRGRSLIAASLALAASVTLSGCLGATPQTARDYTPTDGVDLEVGDLDAQSLLVLAAAEGAPGTLLGALHNTGDQDMTVTIGLADATTDVDVPAGATTLLGPDQTEVALGAVPAAPGALVTVVVSADTAGSATVQAPVLDGTFEQYADLVPGS